jgi:uncharacterized membrane-anchored protein YhcB (DUF1043 family)
MDEILRQFGPFVYLAVMIIGALIARTLKQIDRNQTELWNHMDAHETRLSSLEGSHKTVMETGGHK